MDSFDATRYLYSLGNEVLTAKLGLSNITTLLGSLGSPEKRYPSVLIAGTNGKGSVAAYVSTVLRQAGYKTGLYTSPHLHRIEERIQINGIPISPHEFSCVTRRVKGEVDRLLDPTRAATGDPGLNRHPTYFEMVTAVALYYFAEREIEVAVLEVGLGGRFDATNVVDPVVAAITNVSLDHQRHLGETLEEICFEKAGIIKPRTTAAEGPLPVVYGTAEPRVVALLRQQSLATGARLLPAIDYYAYTPQADDFGRYRLTVDCEFGKGIRIELPLPGEHQIWNALTALRVCEVLRSLKFRITTEQLQNGIRQTHWPGRMEFLGSHPLFILDGAHNPAGTSAVREYVQQFLQGKSLILIFGVMQDKAFVEMGKTLFPLGKHVILTIPDTERAVDPRVIANEIPEFEPCYHFTPDSKRALQLAFSLANPEDVVFVVGSLFLVGEIRSLLNNVDAAQTESAEM